MKKSKNNQWLVTLLVILFGVAISTPLLVRGVQTDPLAPDDAIKVWSSERMNISSYGARSTYAEAGNITEITMNFTSVTRSWAGFFGNITGMLTLDDAQNWTFYDWVIHEPRGEIYASERNNVQWANITCFDFDANVDGLEMQENLTTLEYRFGIDVFDDDGVNETFNRTVHPEFFVGSVNITNNSCPSTNTYVNDTYQTGISFYQILLYENTTNATVFTTIIEDRNPDRKNGDKYGFDNQTHDFQLLVLEDEHPGTSLDTPTQYYFWAEIE